MKLIKSNKKKLINFLMIFALISASIESFGQTEISLLSEDDDVIYIMGHEEYEESESIEEILTQCDLISDQCEAFMDEADRLMDIQIERYKILENRLKKEQNKTEWWVWLVVGIGVGSLATSR